MKTRYLSAHTPATSPYPPFVNLSETEAGGVQITVRGPAVEGDCGTTASATFAKADIVRVLQEALAAIESNAPWPRRQDILHTLTKD